MNRETYNKGNKIEKISVKNKKIILIVTEEKY